MKIVGISKLKDSCFFKALSKVGWTNVELSRRTGIPQTSISRFINLRSRPSEEAASKISNAFAAVGVCFDPLENWPDKFSGFGKSVTIVSEADVPEHKLIQISGNFLTQQIEAPDEALMAIEDERESADFISALTSNERLVMEGTMRGDHPIKIAKTLNISRQTVHSIVRRVKTALISHLKKHNGTPIVFNRTAFDMREFIDWHNHEMECRRMDLIYERKEWARSNYPTKLESK